MELSIQADGKLRYTGGDQMIVTSSTSVPEGFNGAVKVEDCGGRIKFFIEIDGEWTALGDEF